MIILTTAYNCEKYVEKSLFSIMSQRYKDFTCYITDDMSTDNTVSIVHETIKNDSRFILIENQSKLYQPGNYDQIINSKNKPYPVDLELFKLILERYKSLKIEIRFKAGQYTDPKWKDCPNRVASVYVAAIIQYFES